MKINEKWASLFIMISLSIFEVVRCFLSHSSVTAALWGFDFSSAYRCTFPSTRVLIATGRTFQPRRFSLRLFLFRFRRLHRRRLTWSGGGFEFQVNLNKRSEVNSLAFWAAAGSRVCRSGGEEGGRKRCESLVSWRHTMYSSPHLFKWQECAAALMLRGWHGMQFAA